jgi:hypothetical protein
MRGNCRPCEEEAGILRPAVRRVPELGPVCVECFRDYAEARAAERRYAAGYAYASGYPD